MKKLFLLVSFLSIGLLFYSCDEIPGDPNDDTPPSNMKVVRNVDISAQGKLNFIEHMFDVEDSKGYNISEYNTRKSEVDFIGYYTSSDGLSISSPDNSQLAGLENYSEHITQQTLAGANSTDFKVIGNSTTIFNDIADADDIISAYNSASGSAKSKSANIKVNDVIGFRTGQGHYGVFIVTDFFGSAGDESFITIDIKVQRALVL